LAVVVILQSKKGGRELAKKALGFIKKSIKISGLEVESHQKM